MAWAPKRCEICGETLTLTLTSFTWPARSRASCSSAGLTIRQGPHQGAHKFDDDGNLGGLRDLVEGCVVGVDDPRQRLMALAAAGRAGRRGRTRFAWPQCPHRVSPLVMASLSRAVSGLVTSLPAGQRSASPARESLPWAL